MGGQALANDGEVARVEVDPDAARRERGKVESGAASGVEHWRRSVVAVDDRADDSAAVPVKEGFEPAQVVRDVYPVVRLDVSVVVADPLGPRCLRHEVRYVAHNCVLMHFLLRSLQGEFERDRWKLFGHGTPRMR